MGFMSAIKSLFGSAPTTKPRRPSSLAPQRNSTTVVRPAGVRSTMYRNLKEPPQFNIANRRELELKKMHELDLEVAARTFSFISLEWMRKWVAFVEKGQEVPGPISNRSLEVDGRLKGKLANNRDFIVLFKAQADYLSSIYGGDVPLHSNSRDIYSAERRPALPNIKDKVNATVKWPFESSMDSSQSSTFKRDYGTLDRRVSREKIIAMSKLEGGRDATTTVKSAAVVNELPRPARLTPSLADQSTDSLKLELSQESKPEIKQETRHEIRSAPKSRQAAGFYNPSNYCFMNSALQCLFSVAPFADYFLSKSFKRDAVLQTRFSDVLATVAIDYFQGAGVVRPDGLWRLTGSRFPGGRQHDLPELMRYILEELESELKQKKVADLTWENYQRFYNRMLVNTFGGQTVQDVTCKKCRHVSKSYEIFTDIALKLSSSVESSLRDYTEAEHINTDYRCESCKNITSIIKQTRFLRLPNYLILQIKRFESGPYPRKANAMMSFTHSMALQGDGEIGRYQLVAVAVHSGSLGGGHYIAYGRREGTWYLFNDSSCSMVSQSQVTEAQAYLLIYMKQ